MMAAVISLRYRRARTLRIPALASAGRLLRIEFRRNAMPWMLVPLAGTIVIVGGLTFFPALALGPIAEHFAMVHGIVYAAP